METKVCTQCNKEKPLSEFHHTVKRGKPCIKAECKLCNNKRCRDKYRNDPEAARSRVKDYYKENSGVRKEYSRNYHKENKDERRKYALAYRKANKDKIKVKRREYYSKNKERINATHAIWVDENREEVRRKRRMYLNRCTNELSDYYVKQLLRQKNGLTTEQIDMNPELIEERRAIIMLKRLRTDLKRSISNEKKNKETNECPKCASKDTRKNGISKRKRDLHIRQTIYCRNCHNFSDIIIKTQENETSKC